MVDFGADVSTFPDLDTTGRVLTGPRVVAECLLRRFMTRSGTLPYDPDFGLDLRSLLNEDLSDSDLLRIEALVAAEAVKDERIARADVALALIDTKLTIQIVGYLSDNSPFEFVLAIGAVSSAVLQVN